MIRATLFTILMSIASYNVNATVVAVDDRGFIVENVIMTEASAEKVWNALVNDIDLWWPKDHSWWGKDGTFTLEAKARGCFREIAGDKSAEHMHISFVDPMKTLRMTGGLGPLQGMGMFGALNWVFSEKDGNTVVTLTYHVHGINPDGFEKLAPIVGKVQAMQLNGLKNHIEK